jgi:hypothetical protein
MTPIPTAEMNDCCKVVAQIKDRDLERAVTAAVQASEAVADRLHDRIEELEKLAFEKARMVSGLEGEIAGLKHQLSRPSGADVHVRMPPLKVTPVVVTPVPPVPPPKRCVVCGQECISMCPACRTPVCAKQNCGVAHGHGEMYL